jgi:hypothetical protein
VRGAKHSRGRADSKCHDVRVVADARLRNSSNIVNAAFDKSSNKPAKHHARRMGRPSRRRDLFWVLVLYLVTVIGAMVASGVYLLS